MEHLLIRNCTVFGVGRDGITLNGTDSTIDAVSVHTTGCGGITTTGGDGRTLRAGNLTVRGSVIRHTNQWKRTYAPPLGFWGSGNRYENNTVASVPHSGILGSGVNMSFVGNTLDSNCFETTDVGAFYTDGEIGDRGSKANNFWIGRGSKIIGNTFRNIRTAYAGDKKGPGGLSAQAVYLDDMTSGYEVRNSPLPRVNYRAFYGNTILHGSSFRARSVWFRWRTIASSGARSGRSWAAAATTGSTTTTTRTAPSRSTSTIAA